MIKLIIKKRGYFIELPRVSPFRTPAKVDISKLNIGQVVTSLKKQGIMDFEIIETIDKPSKKNKSPEKLVVKEKNNSVNLNDFYERFDRIEGLLRKVINTRSETQEVRTIIKGSEGEIAYNDKEIDVDEEQFIPEVDTKGMKVRTSDFMTRKLDVDIEESSELLSKIKK